MARRGSSSGSGGGCLGAIIILAIIGFIMQSWPYLLLIAGCGLGIWLLVKLFQRLNAQGNGTSTRVNSNVATRANTIVNNNYNSNSDVCHEVDRQIKETLVRRRELNREILRVKAAIAKHSLFWMKNNEKHIQARTEFAEELNLLEGRYNAAVYAFREPVTQEFIKLKSSFLALCKASTRTYDSTPNSGQLSIPYSPKGDMEYVKFSTEPLCISLGDNIFCVVPYYIVHFKKSGAYVSTYSCKAIKGGVANGSYDERVKHVTWTYTRADGLPDRRYKNNPQRVYYTTTTHTVWNMLALGILNYQLKYEVDDSIKNGLIAAIKAYSALLPIKSYDPVHHLIRLLKECDTDNPNIGRIESIIDGGGVSSSKSRNNVEQSVYRQSDVMPSVYVDPVAASKWNVWDVRKVMMGIGVGGLGGLFSLLLIIVAISQLASANLSSFFGIFSMGGFAAIAAFLLLRMAIKTIRFHSGATVISTNDQLVKRISIIFAIVMAVFLVLGFVVSNGETNSNRTLDEQEIASITSQWKADGIVDYTDVALFEKAVNNGEDLIGKTVTFTVVDVRPDSALGFDLWGGEHLNFVSEEDPGIKQGEEITVIVTGVKRVLTDSFKITYVLLEK